MTVTANSKQSFYFFLMIQSLSFSCGEETAHLGTLQRLQTLDVPALALHFHMYTPSVLGFLLDLFFPSLHGFHAPINRRVQPG